MRVSTCKRHRVPCPQAGHCNSRTNGSKVNEDSILAVQVFDQRKFKKKDQGFLGVINVRIGDVIEVVPEADGMVPPGVADDSFRPN